MDPSQLNHYRILHSLGKGGMGEVFAAEDTRLQRKVALKVLSGLMSSDPEQRTRFEREARAVAALNHPSIVTIHSVEEADGVPFLTMELVEGKTLSSLMTGAGLPIDQLLRIAVAVSDAMATAHQRGITHRDLKPGNVMITPDGRVKVLDFGLAKLQEPVFASDGDTHAASRDLTGEGRIIGTVAYMSPEQAEGKPVDQRSDIFSLGVLLHEMATGERPFKGDSHLSVMSSILRDMPSAITDINPNLPAALAKIVRRALAKDPSRRYQTATDLRNELEDLKQELDSAVSATAATVRPPATLRRASSIKAPWWGVVALAVVGVAFALWWWIVEPAPPASAAFTVDRFSRLTNAGNVTLAAISPDGRYVVHIKSAEGKSGLWVRQTATTSDVQIVAPDDVRYDGLTFSPDGNFIYYTIYGRLGGTASLYRIPVLGGTPHRLIEDIDSPVAFSPDASQVAFLRGAPSQGRNYLMIANADGSGIRQLSSMTESEQFQLIALAWSPDGHTILVPVQALKDVPHQAIAAVDVATAAAQVVGGRWGIAREVDWMPDGRSFVVSAVDYGGQTLQLWQVMFPSGERRRITNDLNTYTGVSVARDGSAIATVQNETSSNVWVVDVQDPSKLTQVTSGRSGFDGVAGLSWTDRGQIVYLSSASGRPEVWAMQADGSNQRALTNEALPPLFVSASRDGRSVVFQSPNASGMFLKRTSLDGANVETLTKGGSEFAPIVSPDGRWVYYFSLASGRPRPFKVSIEGGEPVALTDLNFRATSVSPDGSTLLGVGWDENVRRSSYATLPVTGGTPTLLSLGVTGLGDWSPDGKEITYPDLRNGVANIFQRTPDGKERQITRFTSDNIYRFAWSPDGTRLAVARGPSTADVVLLMRATGSADAGRREPR